MTKEFNNTIDFIIEASKLIELKYFEHYALIDAVSMIGYYQMEFNDCYIIGNLKNWIIGFWYKDNYLIYGQDWTKNQLKELKNRVNFKNHPKGFHFIGTKKLITGIVENINYSIFKERLFLSNSKNVKVSNLKNIAVIAEIENLDEITKMLCDYFEEEYKGKISKDFEEMRIETKKLIEKNSIWIIKNEKELISICSIKSPSYNYPIIGSFFTKRNFRNKGFGTKLLQDVTEFLKNEFKIVNLLAEKSNIESNIVFKKLNYKIIYETIDFIIE